MYSKALQYAGALVVIAACTSLAAGQGASGNADGGTATVPAGKAFPIMLESNPSTGYQWQVVKPLSSNLVYVGQKFTPVAPQKREVGSGGTTTLMFKAVKPGPAVIKLVYVRPWEKNVPPVKTYQKNIIVK